MKIYQRKCIKEHTISAQNGDSMTVKKGHEYTTSKEINGKVIVFSHFWVGFPTHFFTDVVESKSTGLL